MMLKKLKNKDKKAEFQVELRNRFTILQNMDQDQLTTEDHWKEIKHTLTTACDASIGSRNRKHQEWISSETLIKIDKRKQLKDVLNNSKTRASKQRAQKQYSAADREVKNSARRDKREFV